MRNDEIILTPSKNRRASETQQTSDRFRFPTGTWDHVDEENLRIRKSDVPVEVIEMSEEDETEAFMVRADVESGATM